MASPNDSPSKNVPIIDAIESLQLYEKVGEMVDMFIRQKVQPKTELLKDALRDEDEQQQPWYRCRHPGYDKTYIQEKRCSNHEVSVHGITIQEHDPVRSPPNPRNEDGIFSYYHNILKYGLLLRDFQNTTKEGDGG